MTLAEWQKKAQESSAADLLDLVLADWEAERKEAAKSLLWLSCLEQAGVDNWGGIAQAQEFFHEQAAQ